MNDGILKVTPHRNDDAERASALMPSARRTANGRVMFFVTGSLLLASGDVSCGSDASSATPTNDRATSLPDAATAAADAGHASDASTVGADAGASNPSGSRDAGLGDTAASADAFRRGVSCGTASVCDDFESYGSGASPGAPWLVSKNAGTIAIDSTRAQSGRQSIKVTAPAAAGYRSVMLRLGGGGLLPVTGGSVYGRMMFYLESSPSASVHWTFVDGAGLVPGTTYHAVYRYGGQVPLPGSDGGPGGSQMMASYDTPDFYSNMGPGSDCYKHAVGRAVPVGAWTCAEWQFDGASNTMRFWMNGAEAADLTVSGTGDGCTQQPSTYVWAAPTFEQLGVGWESYQPDEPRTMWIDDVAYGKSRIGCPPP